MTRVLIIDDETEVLRNVGEMLEMEGYEVSIAVNGREGISQAAANSPDLVICDIAMPYLDGFEVVHALRNSPLNPNVPVIMITGLRDQRIIDQIRVIGANAALTKPFTRSEILTVIASVM